MTPLAFTESPAPTKIHEVVDESKVHLKMTRFTAMFGSVLTGGRVHLVASRVFMRVLDLGCGSGRDLIPWGVVPSDKVTGLDIDGSRLPTARMNFPARNFVCGVGESLPFKDKSFDCVVSGVALPYMNIPKALSEIHRILVPCGTLSLSLHLPGFTAAELLHQAIPRPVPTLFRLYVMANGIFFHYTGNTVGFLKGRTESFQTQRGMTIALARAGFENVSFSRKAAATGKAFAVTAAKPNLTPMIAAA